MIELKNVSKYYNNNGVISNGLHNVSLTLKKGEIVAITGESGSGKSTLLNVITKMDTFDEGEIYFKGNETSYFNIDDMDQFRKNKIGFIFQNYNIIDSYTVLKNVMLPLTINGVPIKEAKIKAKELIEKVGLTHRIKHRGSKLSGGEKQRCVIARALAYDSEILACDEPTGNLDSATGREIIKLIKEVAENKLVLIVTHNFDQVKDIVTRKIKIFDGEIVEDKHLVVQALEDNNEELDLDYKPVKESVNLKLAKDNLLFTPKKTIFTSVVFLFIAFFSLCLYQVCYYSEIDSGYSNNLYYKGDNKVIVYDEAHNQIELDEIKNITNEYTINSFIEDQSIYFRSYNYSFNAAYEKYPVDFKLDGGKMPTEDNDVILLIPSNSQYARIEDKSMLFRDYDSGYGKSLFSINVVGYQVRDDIEGYCITGSDAVYNRMRIEILTNFEMFFNEYGFFVSEINYTSEKSYLLLPKGLENKNITLGEFECEDIYKFDLSKEIDIKYGDVTNPIFYISKTKMLFTNEVYEVSLYGDKNNMIKDVEELGYKYLDPLTYTSVSDLERFLLNLTSYLLMAVASIALVIVYYLSYIILMRVYISKKKDYNIFRTLGVTKKDMKKVVFHEVMIQVVLMSVLIYVVMFILGKTVNNSFFIVFKEITFGTTLIYFSVMIILGYLLGRRFNLRIFKFSVNQVFKKGGVEKWLS